MPVKTTERYTPASATTGSPKGTPSARVRGGMSVARPVAAHCGYSPIAGQPPRPAKKHNRNPRNLVDQEEQQPLANYSGGDSRHLGRALRIANTTYQWWRWGQSRHLPNGPGRRVRRPIPTRPRRQAIASFLVDVATSRRAGCHRLQEHCGQTLRRSEPGAPISLRGLN